MAYLILAQGAWKRYWWDELTRVLEPAGRGNDVGRSNRALLLRQEVVAQPAVPIPPVLRFGVTVFTASQAILIWGAGAI